MVRVRFSASPRAWPAGRAVARIRRRPRRRRLADQAGALHQRLSRRAGRPTRCRESSAPSCRELTGQQFIVENKSGLGRQCRHRRDRQGSARRLHDRSLHHRLAVDRADALRQAAVRRRQGLHRHRHAVVGAQHADGAARPAGQDGARADRACQGQPGKYSFASSGAGTTPHITGELFKQLASVNLLHVPYKGSAPAYQDLLANQVDMMLDNIPGPARPDARRQGARRRRDVEGTPSRGARHPDHGGDPARLRDHLVGRHLRPGRPAAGDGREVRRAGPEGARQRRA